MSEANQGEAALPRRGQRVRREILPAASLFDDDSDLESIVSTERKSNGKSDSIAKSNNAIVKPTVHNWRHWAHRDYDEAAIQNVDGPSKIFHRPSWMGQERRRLHWDARSAITKGERALVSKHDEQSIVLERNVARSNKITQVPFHNDMLAHYNYFAESIEGHDELESFSVSNFNLPPSPWLKDSIIPVLEMNSNRQDLEDNLTTLVLSNCSLSADDMSALARK